MIDLILKDITDRYIRENFVRLGKFLNGQSFLGGDFTFVEVEIIQADANFRYKHGLPFIPTDVVLTAIEGDHRVYFKYQNFDRDFVYISATGPCRLRFFLGRVPSKANRVISEKFTLVPP